MISTTDHRPGTLRNAEIYGLFFSEKAEKEASNLIMDMRVRPMIEQLLLGRLPEKDIAKKINSRFSLHLSTDAVERYHHYYWKVELLKVEDWAILYENNYEAKEAAIAIAQVGPPWLYTSWASRRTSIRSRCCASCRKVSSSTSCSGRPNPLSGEKTKAMVSIARSAVAVDEQLSSSDSALKDSLKAFEQFRMKHGEARIPDVKTLAPVGNYTGSGAKLLDNAPQDDEVT